MSELLMERSSVMYVDILILANLAARPHHGYELKKNVERVLGAEFALNNGVLYPALRRFEEMGAIEREVERQQGRPDRHVYRITPLGNEILHDLLCEFPPELARDDAEFLVRVAFFDVLEPAERLEILHRRRANLRGALDHHDRMRNVVAAEQAQLSVFAAETIRLGGTIIRDELAWIDAMVGLTP